MAHKHYKEMMMYAEDAAETDEPWERWEATVSGTNWIDMNGDPMWDSGYKYRRKPKTININGYEVPEPVREHLEIGSKYYTFDLYDKSFAGEWSGHRLDFRRLDLGFIHSTRKGAQDHFKALLSFTENKDGS